MALGKVASGGFANPGSLVSNSHWHVLFFAFQQMVPNMGRHFPEGKEHVQVEIAD